jgi:hypothetical protein
MKAARSRVPGARLSAPAVHLTACPAEPDGATPPTGLVTVEFSLPRDKTITLGQTQGTISWKENTALTVSAGEGFDAYRWDLDGVTRGEDGGSLTLNAKNRSVKRHRLTAFVTKGVVEYAKILDFTVQP